MADLRQKQPREPDHVYLRYIRAQACCICGDNTSVEAAHLRVGSINDDKRETGGGEKPSDKWALPLCGKHHRESHTMNEMLFWTRYGIDPLALAMHYNVKHRSDDPLLQALLIEHGKKP